MIILDVAGQGLFTHSDQFFNIIGTALKFLAGSLGILLLALFSFAGIIVYSIYKTVQHSSLLRGFRIFIRFTAYAFGLSLALIFILVTGIFFSLPFIKLVLIATIIALIAAFIARETFMLLILKRFGKYIFYLATLHQFSKAAYTYVKKENPNSGAQNRDN